MTEPTPAPAPASVPPAAPAPGSPSERIDYTQFIELGRKEAAAQTEIARLKAELEKATGDTKALQEKIAENERKAAEAQAAATREAGAKAVIEAAKKLRAHDPEAVVALIPQDAVTAAGNGESEALTKALDALVKDKSWLFKPDTSRDPGPKPPPSGGESKSAVDMSADEWKAARAQMIKGSR